MNLSVYEYINIHSIMRPNCREMTKDDIPRVTRMLQEHLKKFKLSLYINESYVKHWILPRKNTVYTYLSDKKDQFFTFYGI